MPVEREAKLGVIERTRGDEEGKQQEVEEVTANRHRQHTANHTSAFPPDACANVAGLKFNFKWNKYKQHQHLTCKTTQTHTHTIENECGLTV